MSEIVFEDVLAEWGGAMWGICKKTCKVLEDAEDAYQNAKIQVWKRLEDFRGESKLSSWIYRITLNECLMLIRQYKYPKYAMLRDALDIQEFLPYLPANTPDPFQVINAAQMGAAIVKSIRDIEPQNRRCFVRHFVDGEIMPKIGKVLKLTLPAVKSRVQRGSWQFKKRMAARGYDKAA